MHDLTRALFVACDAGPVEALAPLAARCQAELNSGAAGCSVDYWLRRMSNAKYGVAVVGTSDSIEGQTLETSVRTAARSSCLPVVVIEDYPGNYQQVQYGDVDLLVVESPQAMALAKHRVGLECPRTVFVSPARYDAMRKIRHVGRAGIFGQWLAARSGQEPVLILWAGQPETTDGVTTLNVLLPLLARSNYKLLFRAHPRDSGYRNGRYELIARALGGRFIDVTEMSMTEVFALAPRILITQFSSLAVEAGFYGIPSVCLLLPEAGKTTFMGKKGYYPPLACQAGAMVLCDDPQSVADKVVLIMEDEAYRSKVLECFDAYYSADRQTTDDCMLILAEWLSGQARISGNITSGTKA